MRQGLFLAALAVLYLLAPPTSAATVEQLLAEGHLRVESTLEPSDPVAPGQKARLYLDVATDGWFTGGTRIELPEAPGLIVLQSKAFAANSTVRRDGRDWVIQRWTLDVYATGEGRFSTGPITLQVKVNHGEGVASGALRAAPVTVVARRPPGLTAGHWVAAPRFSASQSLEPSRATLAPGDAITRTIILEAEDVLDKMLPEIAPGGSEGLSAYPRPARLESSSNRGQSSARRVQEITYVAEAPGDYQLPGYEFAWWDTTAGELRTVALDPVPLTVTQTPRTSAGIPAIAWRVTGAVLALALLGWAAWRWLPLATAGGLIVSAARAVAGAWRRWRAPALPRRLNPWR